ncbi:phytanoyl-CoA dioxygenase [Luminiphilus syltensis NOR5-1B]|uniref:Phytanoyl-CoA dioxygenase n=1 Tax=Luminiphilus syltensis NOR5-1B TaxID=565045 RepID=B8KYN3_9GAMM|nr:phytanoyl-CoA dioxygenase family protein [Luminiphilus syltensis]EED35835.1 phytanoyl-CoA dioxygenase [Luminiphilus syltensis NOR5-1B]
MARKLSDDEISSYNNAGVAFLPQVIDPEWIDRLNALVDEQLSNPGQWVNDANPGQTRDRMFTERYMWQHNPTIRDYVFNSGCAELAAQAMDSTTVRFYFDHLLVKEPETATPTPWHQDVPYWPFKGHKICSIWLALTETTVEESAMEFVRGSHAARTYYRPEVFAAREDHPNQAWTGAEGGEPVPDIEAHRDQFDIVGFDVKPGDAVIFSAWVLHGAQGNKSTDKRRAALSTRWLGDDAVWWPHPGSDPTVSQDDVNLRPGDYPADDQVFPQVWPRT